MELVARAAWASQSKTAQTQDALEMGEEHLDFLPQLARDRVLVGFGEVAGHVAGAFVDGPENLTHRLSWGAPRLKGTSIAVGLARAVAHHAFGIDARARGLVGLRWPVELLQRLAGRTDVGVGLAVVGEVGALEGPVGSRRLVEDGDVRLDAVSFDEPIEHRRRAP